jgi:hypothetical protein
MVVSGLAKRHFPGPSAADRVSMDAMLTEEALILLATLAASGMLVLGVMELVWPTAPRRPLRRPHAPLPPIGSAFAPGAPGVTVRDVARARAGAPPPDATRDVPDEAARVVERHAPPPGAVPDEPSETLGPALDDQGESAAATSVLETERDETLPTVARAMPETSAAAIASFVPSAIGASAETIAAPPSGVSEPTTAEPERIVVDEPVAPLGPSEEPVIPAVPARPPRERRRAAAPDAGRTVLPIETCQAMYDEHRYTEVVSLGSAALEVHARMAAVSHRPDEASALQDLVGLARQELGDREGARAAFTAAITSATVAARPAYVRHLLTLVRGVVDGVNVKDDDAVRVRELRACLAAIASALDVAPGDESLSRARQAVLEAVGRICDRLVPFALDEDGDAAARDLLLDVAGDARMAGRWHDRLRERLAAGSSAEVGQLTVLAVRALQEGRDEEALQALERAERLAAALTGGPEADERREELERRLWWGYTKLGLRRLESRSFDAALDPLFRALRLGRVDNDRLAETRGALMRALDGVAEHALPAIKVRRDTDPAAAAQDSARLASALQAWTTHHLTEQDLGEAHERITVITEMLA